MKRTLRKFMLLTLSALFALALPDMTSLLLGTGDQQSAGKRPRRAERAPLMREYFYAQRLFGCPDADIIGRTMYEAERMRIEEKRLNKATLPGNIWIEEGPWNIGGRMRAIAVHPSNPNVVYAGAASGGIWKSNDFGENWLPIGDNIPILPVGAIAIDPNNPARIYAGTGEPVAAGYQGGSYVNGRINASPVWSTGAGVMRSDDGGLTWTQKSWNSPFAVHRIAVSPDGGDTVFAASINGLWKTTNGGDNWSRTSTGIITDTKIKPGQSGRVYLAIGNDDGDGANGVYVSDAGGRSFSWRKISVNFPAPDSCGRILLDISPADPDRIYAAVARSHKTLATRDNDFLLLMVSTNGGDTWERKINAISTGFPNGQAYYDLALAVSPSDPNVVFLGGLDVYRSTNGGGSFVRMTRSDVPYTDSRYVHVDIHHFAFKPGDPNTIMVANDGGFSVSTNLGVGWSRRVNNLGTVQYYSCNYDPGNPTYFFGGTQDNGTHGKFSNDNAAWYELFGGDGGSVVVDPAKPTVRYVNSLYSNPSGSGYIRPIIRLGVGNATVLGTGLNSGENADRFTWVPPLMFHPTDRTRLYTATQYVYTMRNPDVGTNPRWNIISPELGLIVTRLAVAPSQTDRMYAVTSNGWAWVTNNVTSTSPTWTRVITGLPSRWLTDLAIDGSNADLAYVTASGYGAGHVFKTTNAGQAWTNISSNLPDLPANAIEISRSDPNTLFVATDIGVYYTVNGGASWQRFGDGLPNAIVYDMVLTPQNKLLAGTFGRGMWTTDAVVSAGDLPQAGAISLGQCYPSAARLSTTIPFSLTRRASLSLKLYDVNGRFVKALGEGSFGAGNHSIDARVADLAPGMYYYRLTAGGGFEQTRKMLVVR